MSSTLSLGNVGLDELCEKAKRGLKAKFAQDAQDIVDREYKNREIICSSHSILGWLFRKKTKKQIREQIEEKVKTTFRYYDYFVAIHPTKHKDYERIERIYRACSWASDVTLTVDDLALLESWAKFDKSS